MNKSEVIAALDGMRTARSKWALAQTTFTDEFNIVMKRLLNEAAINYMSAEDIAKASGLTVARVRALMRENNLNPKNGKRLLAKTAATTLSENAALLGVEPADFDLTSPLAYLPMGSQLREFLRNEVDPDEVLEEDEVNVVEAIEALQRLADECLVHAPNKDAVHEDYALVHRLIGKVTA